MFFKGTKNRSAKQIAESIEEVGGQINAFTGKEATCFYTKVLDTHLELSLDVLSDMLFNSKFLSEDIEKEQGVIVEEINMSEDSPEDVLSDLHSNAIWEEDSLSLPILGTEDTVRSFTREQLLEYISSYYIPENSVISLCGKFDAKITSYSSPIISSKHLYQSKDIEQLHISLGLNGLEIGNDDIYSLILLNNMFGGGAASDLFQKIREERGLCYTIYSYLSSFNNTGVVSIYTGLNSKHANEVLELIKEELASFIGKDITNEKLLKLKEQLKGSYILGLESTSSRMFSNGKSILFQNRINTPNDIIGKIDKINRDKLDEVKQRTFSKGILNSAYVGPNVDLKSLINIIEGDTIAFKNDKSQRV
jgi:predicted Zn-dependent peptidase